MTDPRRPYQGIEESGFYEYIRVGTVLDIELGENAAIGTRPTYGTMKVRWKDKSYTAQEAIPISFPASGDGWGIYSFPDVNDTIIAGYRNGGFPVILGCLPKNPESQIGSPDPVTGERKSIGLGQTFRPIRYLIPGEILIKSKEGTEVYMDREGLLQMIVREKTDPEDKDFKDPIVELRIGNVRTNDKYLLRNFESPVDNPLLVDEKQIHLDLKHKSGLRIQIDEEGTLSITTPKNLTLQVTGDTNVSVTGNANLSVEKNVVADIKGTTQLTAEGDVTAELKGNAQITVDGNTTAEFKGSANIKAGGATIVEGNQIKLGDQSALALVNELFLTSHDSHVHLSTAPGSPTSPPTVPSLPTMKTAKVKAS
jgi:hypothetical protein